MRDRRTLDQLVDAVVATAPPLTADQRSRLAGLLTPAPVPRRKAVMAA